MKLTLITILLLTGYLTMAQSNTVGIFKNNADIGNPKIKGAATFDAGTQTYSIKGGGANVWFNRDEFHYLYNKLKGDFILTANVKLLGQGVTAHRKIGWMIRESEKEESAHICAVVHGDGLTALQWRPLRGSYMRDPEDEIFDIKNNVQIIQVERSGKKIIMRAAAFGEPLHLVGIQEMKDMPDEVLAGLFLCSHNADVLEEANAWNVRIEQPVADTYDGYKNGFLTSSLETLNIFDGVRKVIHQDTGRFEAPNWMPDGKSLLFNQDGLMYTVPVEGGLPQKLNTGSAIQNNNDHVISFDGKMLAISNQRKGFAGGGSAVYVLPLKGGEPRLITDSTPSYLHGWSPDNKEVTYVAKRLATSKVYNIYKKNINGGTEIQLTFNKKSHVDGPEYTPDGKYIYYNADETGTMQVWRMKPDGSNKEQITFDEYNNWFPHISPDGKWIALLSFPATVLSSDHPFYKRVMLRLMPVSGGAPKVIAYLYGGQGTINTNSWSPDSKQIAFVSNGSVE